MLTLSDVVAHLEKNISINRMAQDRLIYDLKCFVHRSNRRYAADKLSALALENDVCGDLLNWILDNLNRDSWVSEQPIYNQDRTTPHDGGLSVFNQVAELAVDNNRCDVLV